MAVDKFLKEHYTQVPTCEDMKTIGPGSREIWRVMLVRMLLSELNWEILI